MRLTFSSVFLTARTAQLRVTFGYHDNESSQLIHISSSFSNQAYPR